MRIARYVVILLCLAAAASAARAGVTVEGTIQYWDELEGRYRPAQHVTVEVERDWALDDPEVETDDLGHYRIDLPNPWWGTHDGVDLEVYAETAGRSHVYYSMFDFWPYYVNSRSYDDVPPDSVLKINLNFGKPAGTPGPLHDLNVDSPYEFETVDAAKAFLVHQEMYAYYLRLKSLSWPDDAVGDKDVIVPAAGVTSYYNHVTNNINLVTADWSGFGAWPPLPRGGAPYVAFPGFRYTVRHEYSHAVHDEITTIAPVGLNWPSSHSAEMESNRFIAWTEGFADFLALVTIGNPTHRWEPSLGTPGALPVLVGDHYAMEAEVTGLLWDLHDPQGYEVLRHPARQSADGLYNLPPGVVAAQRFHDGLADPDAEKVRQAASTPLLAGVQSATGSVETLAQFLACYAATFPAPHEIKAIAHNRDVALPFPKEFPAVLAGNGTIRRWANTVTLEVMVEEDDSEDRPFVRLTLYHELSDGTVQALPGLTNLELASGWQGARRPVTAKATLRPGFHPGDVLWLEVNDDILPRVYRFTVPLADDGVVTAAIRNEPLAGPHATLPPGIVGRVDAPGLENPATRPLGEADVWEALDREDFEASLDRHWTLRGATRLSRGAPRTDRVLLADGFGIAVWDAADREVVGVRMAYRQGGGVADVLTSLADATRLPAAYHLLVFADRIALVREAQGTQAELASAPLALAKGVWCDIQIVRRGGAIRVSIDGREVLRAVDAAPLPAGKVAFGALVGTGFAFDDVVFFSALEPGGAPRPVPPHAAPPSDGPLLGAVVRRSQDLGDLVREAREELRAYGDLVRRRERLDRALFRLAQTRGALPASVEAARVFPRRRAAVARTVRDLEPAAAAAHGAYARWLGDRAHGRALAAPLPMAQKSMLHACLADLQSRTRAQRATPARVADLRQRLQTTFASLDLSDTEVKAQTERTVTALDQALERIETDTDLRAALERQQAALETMGR